MSSSSSSSVESSGPDEAVTSLLPRGALPMMMTQADLDISLEGRFDASMFRGLYQRNNKRGGLKNLRCFPSCSTEHRVRGFCGRSVVVTFRKTGSTIEFDPSKQYRAYVEFEEEPFEDRRPARMPLEEMDALLRTKSKPTNPVMEGKHCFTKESVMVFEFNQERRGWHYSWGSNKHKCDTKHRLLCRLYEVQDGDVLTLRARCSSPEFVLFCRRRRRFTLEPSASSVAPAILVASASSTGGKDSSSKRQRRTPNQSKFAQEIELLTTVHRIESTRGLSFGNDDEDDEEDAGSSDEEEEEEDSEEDEEDEIAPPPPPNTKKSRPRGGGQSSLSKAKAAVVAEEQDVTEATHALLALTGAKA